MGAEPEAGTVSAAQAMMLLLLEPADLKQLERAGAFRPIAPGRYGLVDLVQGFARHVRKADALVSSAALARHFDCVPAYIRKLVEQGVIERRGDGRFDMDQFARIIWPTARSGSGHRSRRLIPNSLRRRRN
jgi:hypothetical protein